MVRIVKAPLEDIIGSTFVGNVGSTFLFGILTVQVVLYHKRFPRDSKWTRGMVGILWVAIAFQTVFMTKMIWWWYIQNYFNPEALAKPKWEFFSYHLSTTVGSLIAQSFFVNRIWGLSGNVYIVVPLQALVITQFTFATTLLIVVDTSLSFNEIAHRWNWVATVWLTIQGTCDALIAMLMTFLLWHRKTGFKKTDRAINTMVYWSVATGSITCVQSLITIGIFASRGFAFGALLFAITLSPMYPISMLTNLHMRSTVRKQLSAPTLADDRPTNLFEALRSVTQRKVMVSRGRRELIELSPRRPRDLAMGNLVVNIRRSMHEDGSSSHDHRLYQSSTDAPTFRNSICPTDVEFSTPNDAISRTITIHERCFQSA
ncbi:uncharacterized protein EI90DRAFT_3129996 [Cantharellus anzutake]|uniref:uncharacterized protein n=1 Tax=Cantharellus anzutake TaxID=1750568 RepID=UPI0019069828|nr:uncharacterized protein EI90DRAFT_3129996 [Cantharellus anzutake]KAF8324294.1 hypothetical protein EI90DRAFT_3129996 [Cantharellus anzutake]